MVSAVTAPPAPQPIARSRDDLALVRLVWVAPLALLVALAVNLAIKFIAVAVHPNYARMPQLQEPMVILTIEGVLAAVVAFVAVALLVPRPVFWYRVLGVVALLISVLPDIALAVGGQPMFATMRMVGTLTSIGAGAPAGPPAGGRGAGQGGPPPGFTFTTPIDQVLLLMLLHVATAAVSIILLTTLTRRGAWPRFARRSARP